MTQMQTTPPFDLEALNQQFESAHPSEVVRWAYEQFGEDLILSSSFGAESAVMLGLSTEVFPAIKVVMVDTGYLFPETYQFMEELRLKLGLNIWTYRTKNDPIEYLKQAAEEDHTWRNNVEACCAANKNEPMERAMQELKPKAWLRGIRRQQASTRGGRQFVEWSDRYNCWAISPLLTWGGKEVYEYLQSKGLPYHPLWEKGYLSIGCNPLS